MSSDWFTEFLSIHLDLNSMHTMPLRRHRWADWANWVRRVAWERRDNKDKLICDYYRVPGALRRPFARCSNLCRRLLALISSAIPQLRVSAESRNGLQIIPPRMDNAVCGTRCPAGHVLKDARCDAVCPAANPPQASLKRGGLLEAGAFKSLPQPQQVEVQHELWSQHPHVMIEVAGQQTVYRDEFAPDSLSPPEHDPEEEEALLRLLSEDRRNVILDSTSPRIPHIVITPPPFDWNDFFVPAQNAAGPQWPTHLGVPPAPGQFDITEHVPGVLPEDALQSSSGQWQEPFSPHDDVQAAPPDWESAYADLNPKAVFSHSKFSQAVQSAEAERLVFRNIITALQKHQFKIAAHTACRSAPSFRQRYDRPELMSSLERPFHWTDPAEAILALGTRLRGTLIVDSVRPCTVPHIMINEGPPPDPWVAWANRADAQDARRLTVYACAPPRAPGGCGCDACDGGCDGDGRGCAHADGASRADTPAPATPFCADDLAGFGAEGGARGAPGGRDDGLGWGACAAGWGAEAVDGGCFAGGYEGEEDEDEDGLPPLDDWYKTILERQQAACP